MITHKPNNNFNLVVFDLDGTLIQSHDTIFESVIYSLKMLGITNEPDKDEFMKQIGHHFFEIFESTGIIVNDFDKFMHHYKAKYFSYIDLSTYYPGVLETLEWLKGKDIKIALLTTKLQDQADKIIDHFKLRKYFNEVAGRRKGIANKPAAEPLLNICNKLNVASSVAIMVGDTELDIKCGKNAGAATCGVTFGYRSVELLQKENPDFIIDEMGDLKKIINNSG